MSSLMRNFLLSFPFALAAALLLSACNPVSYFMVYKYSSAEKKDDLADQRITELERERAERMAANSNYREAEIEAYRRARGINATSEGVNTRPISTEELRARLEKQAAERRK